MDRSRLTLFSFVGDHWQRLLAHNPVPSPGITVVPIAASGEASSALIQVGEVGAVVVRPDGHVFWRTSSPAHDATPALLEAIRQNWGNFYGRPDDGVESHRTAPRRDQASEVGSR
ncbi:aromatic-ring hydroxylase C-terminal domain-containing protein [Nocardia vinacea]|uniref:aromatic-ring hydroxylase C-terminal domain-containing protein n=1 Tax=Nocardia vinacea TaxID=96468 RepID=UPI003570C3C9